MDVQPVQPTDAKIQPLQVLDETTTKLQIGQDGFNDDVIIGGSDPAKAEPRVDLTRWKWGRAPQQVAIEFLPDTPGDGTHVVDGQKTIWQRDDLEHHVYGKEPDGTNGDRGNLELELILNSPPATNVFNWRISGADDLQFYFQPPLTDAELKEGIHRPENVVGSYAVYHSTCDAHKLPGPEKVMGMESKAFHIYRPAVVDALGNQIWGDLTYEKGIISVIVDPQFLAAATYPVSIDPTFGYTTVGATDDGAGSTNIYATVFTPPAGGTITKITIRVGSRFGAVSLGAAVYADNAGQAGTFLASDSGHVAVSAANTWNSVNLSLAFSAVPLWLAQWASVNNCDYVFDAGAANQRVFQTGATPFTWPAPFAKTGQDARKYSIYATYTPASTTSVDQYFPGIQQPYPDKSSVVGY